MIKFWPQFNNPGLSVAPYLILIVTLLLTPVILVLIKNLKTPPVKELVFQKAALHELSEELQAIDAQNHYLGLWEKLLSLSNKQDLFSKERSPLRRHRIQVDDKGIISINEQNERIYYTEVEKLTIAIAIYQLAYVISIKSLNANTELLIRQGVVPLLMQPFSHLYGNLEVKQIEAELRQLTYANHRKIISPKNYATQAELEAGSAQIIQRAFRKHRFKTQLKNGDLQVEEIGDLLRESMAKHYISENPKKPNAVAFTPAFKLNWAKGAKPGFETMATTLVQYLVIYRSHDKFMGRLQEVVNQFNAYQHSLPEHSRDFVLVVPKVSYQQIKSNHWVNALALPFFIKKPLAILYPSEIAAFKETNPSLQQLVFLDDALYSGRQLAELISTSLRGLNKVVLLPFYNKHGLYRLPADCKLIVGERMLTAKDIEQYSSDDNSWTRDTTEKFDQILPHDWSAASTKVGYVFNHKIADKASTFFVPGLFSDGLNRLHRDNEPLLPRIKKPY